MGIMIFQIICICVVCALGAYSMKITNGETGIGYVIVGIYIILSWHSSATGSLINIVTK